MKFSLSSLMLFCLLASLGGMINTWEYRLAEFSGFKVMGGGWPLNYRTTKCVYLLKPKKDGSAGVERGGFLRLKPRFKFWGMVTNLVFWMLVSLLGAYMLMSVWRQPINEFTRRLE